MAGVGEAAIGRRTALRLMGLSALGAGLGGFWAPRLLAQTAPQDALYAAATGFPAPVETAAGKVRGLLVRGGVRAFRGIPYGRVAGRFQRPAPAPAWMGVRDATAFGPACVQRPATLSPLGRLALYDGATRREPQSEDCLTLNVWAPPAGGRARPVMVWFHGGAFNSSSSANPASDGTNLAATGEAVVVSFNHRVGLFGFLNADVPGSANAGMLDMVAALRWVRENIAAFCGDPGNVTVFGGAAGGEKISVLLAMPEAKGLFHRAIIQSGPRRHIQSQADSERLTDAVLAELALDRTCVGELATLPAERLLAVEAAAVRRSAVPRGIGPAVDGVVLLGQPFDKQAPASLPDVPIMIGTNKDEMTFGAFLDPKFGALTEAEMLGRVKAMVADEADAVLAHYGALHPGDAPPRMLSHIRTDRERREPSIAQAEMILSANRSPVYMYILDWETPIGEGAVGAVHMLEQPLVFRNVTLQPNICGTGPDAEAVSRQMSAAWLAFAKSGNPNAKGLPRWPSYRTERRATMIFDVQPRLATDPGRAERELWRRLNG
jgi:para-nitrobenzyl esterase